MSDIVRFLIVGDLHGVIPKIHTHNFDAIICPGDVCGDDMRKYIDKLIMLKTSMGEDSQISLESICSPKEIERQEKISREKGRKVLEKLNSYGKPVFLVPGNWDQTPYQDGTFEDFSKIAKAQENLWRDEIIKGFENIHDVEFKKKLFRGIIFIGHGSTSGPEPAKVIPPELFESEKEFIKYALRYNFFAKAFKKLSSYLQKEERPVIMISHNPPYNTKLDLVDKPGTYAHRKHYGSVIARKLIENYEPLICISGHIHEGWGKTRLKNTICINAGFGPDVNTILEINVKEKKIEKIEFLGKNKIN